MTHLLTTLDFHACHRQVFVVCFTITSFVVAGTASKSWALLQIDFPLLRSVTLPVSTSADRRFLVLPQTQASMWY
jgi:hypothetical protein